jgi:hypothetical protein
MSILKRTATVGQSANGERSLFHGARLDQDLGLRARAASGHATAAPPSNVMKSRRLIVPVIERRTAGGRN